MASRTQVEFKAAEAWDSVMFTRLSFLPRPLNAIGVRANYSYTSSQATFPVGFGRTDHPSLVRTAPNNWNFDVTYDKKGFPPAWA